MAVYKIPTGRDSEFMDVEIPERNVICHGVPRKMKGITDLKGEIKRALRNPIGSPPISQLVKRDSKVCLLVDDITRPTPAHQILPSIVEELSAAGVRDDQIKLIVACGLHRAMTLEEIERKVGPEMVRRFPPICNDGVSEGKLTYIGQSSRGTPVWINKEVAESNVIIGIGGILLHQFMGYGGGAKIILPGICGRKTVTYNHNMFSEEGVPGNLENPCRLDIEEIARMVGISLKVDVVMNAENEIVGVFAGEVVAEHREAVKLYDKIYKIHVPEKADIILTTTLPKTITFVQGALLPMFSMPAAAKPGGTIIMYCPATEGFSFVGKRAYEDHLRARLTEEQIRQMVKDDVIFEAHSFANLARVREKYNFVAVSENLGPQDIVTMGLGLDKSVSHAMERAFSKHGKDAKVVVIPYGFSTLPSLEK